MCSGVTVSAHGRVGRRAAGAFATNTGFYSTVSEVPCKYQGLCLVQNEKVQRWEKASGWYVWEKDGGQKGTETIRLGEEMQELRSWGY